MSKIPDVPSPIDFHLMGDALAWESTAMDRPFRTEMFEHIENSIDASGATRVLELGSGPGFLAAHLCRAQPSIELTLLDSSRAMHSLAGRRLAEYRDRIAFIERDFRREDWAHELGTFEGVVTMQALHELRHKRHGPLFHQQLRRLLAPGASYLVCDHFYGEEGMNNDQLYASVQEHVFALEQAGFSATLVAKQGSLVLFQAN